MSDAAGVRARLETLYRAAIDAVDPARVLTAQLRRDAAGGLSIAGLGLAPRAKLFVLSIGKAGATLAAALESIAADAIHEGFVLVPEGCERPLERCALRVASHPLPDARGERATRELWQWLERPGPEDTLLVLLSGGGSSLLCAPAEGLALDDLVRTSERLLASGAAIDELNTVRKHLSLATGGRLATRCRAARIEVLAISDVIGDRPEVVASGPFAPDPSRYRDALDVLDRRDPERAIPLAVREHLEAGARGERPETPGPEDPGFARCRHVWIANNARALDAAALAADAFGWRVLRVGDALCGEARDAARRLIALADACRADERPLCLLAGGETVVTLRGGGRGGRCQELALAAALAIDGRPELALLAAGSDGADGPTDAAGAFADGGSVVRGRARGLDAAAALGDNDSHTFFDAEGGLLRTGASGTNVMDLVFVLRAPMSAGAASV